MTAYVWAISPYDLAMELMHSCKYPEAYVCVASVLAVPETHMLNLLMQMLTSMKPVVLCPRFSRRGPRNDSYDDTCLT